MKNTEHLKKRRASFQSKHLKKRHASFQWWGSLENREELSQNHFKKSSEFLTGREIQILFEKNLTTDENVV